MMYIILTILLLFCLFDIYYFLRGIFVIVCSTICKKKHILDECVISGYVHGICLTTDLDFNLHMNNGRYLRECDFGRYDFWYRTGTWQILRQSGATLTNGGNNIRYRKSIEFLDRFNIHSRVIYWDEKSFYVEQKLVRTKDNFICAIALVKQSILGMSPAEVVSKLDPKVIRPEPLPELTKWLESFQISSERLRKSQ